LLAVVVLHQVDQVQVVCFILQPNHSQLALLRLLLLVQVVLRVVLQQMTMVLKVQALHLQA
jgi:hypothetical protein